MRRISLAATSLSLLTVACPAAFFVDGFSAPILNIHRHRDDIKTCLFSTQKEIAVPTTTTPDSWESFAIEEDESSRTSNTEDSCHEAEDESDNLDLVNQEEFDQWCKAVQKSVDGLVKKQNSLQRELEKAQQIQAKTDRANLIKSNLYLFPKGVRVAMVQDWETGESVEITIDPSFESAVAEVDALFSKIRKIKRGSEVVQVLLEETTATLTLITQLQQALTSCSPDDPEAFQLAQAQLLRTASQTQFAPPTNDTTPQQRANGSNKSSTKQQRHRKPPIGTPASNIRKLSSPGGTTILVGRNRRGNEYLSLTLANSNDIWMHARGTPGAHVVLRNSNNKMMDDDCWQCAANVAAFYSDGRSEAKVLVSATEAKHVTKPRGAPLGAVQLRQELRVVTGYPANVPDALKEARSAGSTTMGDAYRAADKAKLRKQNRQRQAAKREGKKAKQEK